MHGPESCPMRSAWPIILYMVLVLPAERSGRMRPLLRNIKWACLSCHATALIRDYPWHLAVTCVLQYAT